MDPLEEGRVGGRRQHASSPAGKGVGKGKEERRD
jgi:hypothetical protein